METMNNQQLKALKKKAQDGWDEVVERMEKVDNSSSQDQGGVVVTEQTENMDSTIASIDKFIETRNAFIEKVNKIFVEKQDFHVIKGKKSMAKGGAEKLASIFQWQASFTKDADSVEMLGNKPGLVALKCTLTKNGAFVGEGRGAAMLDDDPNKTLKMAQKSAFIDAVLRTSGLSDFFTQDIEDMPIDKIDVRKVDDRTVATPKQKNYIALLCQQKGIDMDELAELTKKYNSPSKLIDYLKGIPTNDPDYGQMEF